MDVPIITPQTALTVLAIGLALLFLMGLVGRFTRFSTLPFFIVAGMIAGVLAPESTQLVVAPFATTGIVLLLFLVGLEFSVTQVVQGWKRVTALASIDLFVNLPVGVLIGLALGFDLIQALFLGGALFATSTAILSRSLIDLGRLANPEAEPALSMMVGEDLLFAFYLVLLIGLTAGNGTFEMATIMKGGAYAVGYAVFVVTLGFIAKRPLEWLADLDSDELFVLGLMGLVTALAAGGVAFGLSEAVTALLTGMVLGGTPVKARAQAMLQSLQHLFCALFFLGFGLALEWQLFGSVLVPAVLITIVAIASKLATGIVAGRYLGLKWRTQWRLAFLLVPRGEFSVVLAAMALAALGTGAAQLHATIGLATLILAIVGTVLIAKGDALLPQKAKAPAAQPRVSVVAARKLK